MDKRSRRSFLIAAGLAGLGVQTSFPLGAQPAPASPLLLLRFHAPNKGAADAKVNVVEFLDPACEACRAFHPLVKKLLEDNPGRVRVWVRYVPFHRGADVAVRALEAARLQNKLWEAMDALFENQDKWTRNHAADPAAVIRALDGIGLDMTRMRADMQSPEIDKILAQDMADAKALKVLQTPTFFVNGKPLPEHGFKQLETFVRQEVAAQYR